MKKFTRTIHFVEVAVISVNVSDMTMDSRNVQLAEVDPANTKAMKKAIEKMGYACDMVKVIREYDELRECTVEEFLSISRKVEK